MNWLEILGCSPHGLVPSFLEDFFFSEIIICNQKN